jgi:hypothetical protein
VIDRNNKRSDMIRYDQITSGRPRFEDAHHQHNSLHINLDKLTANGTIYGRFIMTSAHVQDTTICAHTLPHVPLTLPRNMHHVLLSAAVVVLVKVCVIICCIRSRMYSRVPHISTGLFLFSGGTARMNLSLTRRRK